MARVLLCNFTEDTRRKKVKAALFRAALPSLEVPPSGQGKVLGALLGLEGFSETAEEGAESFGEEMIVMHGLTPRQFHGFLDGIRAAGIRIPLKAVTTESNLGWSAARLHRELAAEREALEHGGKGPVHEET